MKRTQMKMWKVCLVSVALAFAFGASGAKADDPRKLRMLTWEGYTEPEWLESFEEENNVEVSYVYLGSDDDLLARVNAGGGENFDLIAMNLSFVELFADLGYILPLDQSRLTEWDHIIPAFRDDPRATVDGNLYTAPMCWGNFAIIYDEELYSTPPDSWGAVFEPPADICGRTLLTEDAGTTISTAALYLGYDNVYQLSDEQLEEVEKVLNKAASCAKAFWSGWGDAAQYFASESVEIGIEASSLVTHLARQGGAKVANSVPKEGAIGWMDAHAIMKGGEGKEDLIYAWINYSQSAEVQTAMAEKTLLGPVRQDGVIENLDPDLVKTMRLGDPAFFDSLVGISRPKAPDSWEKRLKLWNRVKAGAL